MKGVRKLRLLPYLILWSTVLHGHDPVTTKLTWSQEISRIFVKRCMSCHREGGTAPMALTSFEESRPWAKAIKEEVLNRKMPPWGALKGFGEFRNDASLKQEEIMRLAEWVEGGAPEGDPLYLPQVPTFTNSPRTAKVAGPTVENSLRMTKPFRLGGIRPSTSVDYAEVTAQLPDGQIVPLLALKDYKGEWKRTFELAEPLNLPPGARITVAPPAAVQLIPASEPAR